MSDIESIKDLDRAFSNGENRRQRRSDYRMHIPIAVRLRDFLGLSYDPYAKGVSYDSTVDHEPSDKSAYKPATTLADDEFAMSRGARERSALTNEPVPLAVQIKQTEAGIVADEAALVHVQLDLAAKHRLLKELRQQQAIDQSSETTPSPAAVISLHDMETPITSDPDRGN